jgi:hypothetical protein
MAGPEPADTARECVLHHRPADALKNSVIFNEHELNELNESIMSPQRSATIKSERFVRFVFKKKNLNKNR